MKDEVFGDLEYDYTWSKMEDCNEKRMDENSTSNY